MPRKSEKIKIQGTKYDRRIKLTPDDRKLIKFFHNEGWSQRKLAIEFDVNRSLIRFVLFPEKLERNIQLRKERGGSMLYYDKDKAREQIREHRQYKEDLKKQGLIE